MKQFFFILVLFSLFNFTTDINLDKLLLCKCSEKQPIEMGKEQVQKKVYIFLVKGKDGRACCNNLALTDYTGYRETWHNEAPEHPTVWGMDESARVKISSKEAQEIGCALSTREISVVEVDSVNHFTKEYYPMLKLRK